MLEILKINCDNEISELIYPGIGDIVCNAEGILAQDENGIIILTKAELDWWQNWIVNQNKIDDAVAELPDDSNYYAQDFSDSDMGTVQYNQAKFLKIKID